MRFRRYARIALDHIALHLDRAAHGVDHAAKFNEEAVARALDDPAAMHGDCGIDEVAADCAQPRENPIFVGASEPTVAGNVGD